MGINCIVVTPEDTALDTKADLVVVPLSDGEVGIQSEHAPMIGRLGYGEMRITNGDSVDRYYVDGGFVQVAGNQVSVITNRATMAKDLDLSAAESALKEAEALPSSNSQEIARKQKALQQARAQINVANK